MQTRGSGRFLFSRFVKFRKIKEIILTNSFPTGHAQVNGGYSLKPEEKIIYDMEYIEKRSIWMDLACIGKTIRVVLCGAGAR